MRKRALTNAECARLARALAEDLQSLARVFDGRSRDADGEPLDDEVNRLFRVRKAMRKPGEATDTAAIFQELVWRFGSGALPRLVLRRPRTKPIEGTIEWEVSEIARAVIPPAIQRARDLLDAMRPPIEWVRDEPEPLTKERVLRICELVAASVNATWPELVEPFDANAVLRLVRLLSGAERGAMNAGRRWKWEEIEALLQRHTGERLSPDAVKKTWDRTVSVEEKESIRSAGKALKTGGLVDVPPGGGCRRGLHRVSRSNGASDEPTVLSQAHRSQRRAARARDEPRHLDLSLIHI